MYHVACFVLDRVPKHVVQCFLEIRLTPQWRARSCVDHGGEFELACLQECAGDKIDVRITRSHARWQQGWVETHGGLLGDFLEQVVYEFHIKGMQQGKMVLAMCMRAKNATLTRSDVTRNRLCF